MAARRSSNTPVLQHSNAPDLRPSTFGLRLSRVTIATATRSFVPPGAAKAKRNPPPPITLAMYDPDLHLFVNDEATLGSREVVRKVHSMRRESAEPVMMPPEGHSIGWVTVARDDETGDLKMWYPQTDVSGSGSGESVYKVAVSKDGFNWSCRGDAFKPEHRYSMSDFSVAPVGPDVDPWFEGAKFVAAATFNDRPTPAEPDGTYLLRSMDGVHFEARFPCALPHKGDRMFLGHDQVQGEYLFITRPYYGYIPGFTPIDSRKVVRHRMANLWKSRDLVNWQDFGIVLRFDDDDHHDLEIHTMECFRYGRGFLALVEIFRTMGVFDVQLACSPDGISWQRVGRRETILGSGGQDAWDSGLIVPATNPPIACGDRLWVFYRSIRRWFDRSLDRTGVGLASLRKDGWVSLDAGRNDAMVVTRRLPLTEPMKLELNVNCMRGRMMVDVIADDFDKHFEPMTGYEGDASPIEQIDATSHRVTWRDREVVLPNEFGGCFLRFRFTAASLFSFRWSRV